MRHNQSFDRYIEEKGYGIKAMVACSRTVPDDQPADIAYTEVQMYLGLREKRSLEVSGSSRLIG